MPRGYYTEHGVKHPIVGSRGRRGPTRETLPTQGGGSTELTTEERNRLPDSAFAIESERKYPVPTVEQLRKAGAPRPEVSGPRHALNAIQRVETDGTPQERIKVRAVINTRYPEVLSAHDIRTRERS